MSALTDPPMRRTAGTRPVRRPPGGERRDPAPSRFSYRWHRIWLTPHYRRLLRLGLPAFLLAMGFGIWFGDAGRREQSFAWIAAIRDSVVSRPEFRVSGLVVSGASAATLASIEEVLGLSFPVSSFSLDLEALRERLRAIDAVADAELRVNAEGALEVRVEERLPILVWRQGEGLELLDETGHRVAALAARSERPDLPLIAGQGAAAAVPEALAILAAAEPLRARMRGLVRIGERRWDIVLDRHQRIMLPATGAAPALERLIALDQAEDLLDRDVVAVDLRNGHRPTLRLAPHAMALRLGIDPAATLASARKSAPIPVQKGRN